MYVGLHNHTATGSNIRGFLDSTNRIDELIKYSKSLGHNGIAITDHDCISVHMQAIDCVKELKQKANKILALQRKGIKLIFPDVLEIEQKLLDKRQ